MALVYAICECNPAIWDFRSKKEFNEMMENGSGGHQFIRIDQGDFQFQRLDNCAMCGYPLKLTEPIYTKKSLLEWAKHQIGKELRQKYN